MKAEQLRVATVLAERRETNLAMRKRLLALEPISLVLGAGSTAAVIVPTPAFAERLRRALLANLDDDIARDAAALREHGVEV